MGWRTRRVLSPAAALMTVLLVLGRAGTARGDFASEQAECSEALVGLSTCLTYVEGSARSPTPDCCAGLKQVIGKSPKCLCILIKDRDNPQLGFKIDAARAVALPGVCSVPANISHCPGLLKLDPNSKDAEVFKQLGSSSSTKQANNATGSGGAKAKDSSAAARSHRLAPRRRRLLGVVLVHWMRSSPWASSGSPPCSPSPSCSSPANQNPAVRAPPPPKGYSVPSLSLCRRRRRRRCRYYSVIPTFLLISPRRVLCCQG